MPGPAGITAVATLAGELAASLHYPRPTASAHGASLIPPNRNQVHDENRDPGAAEPQLPEPVDPRWPACTRRVEYHGTLIRLHGSFADDDLDAVWAIAPQRQVTRDRDAVTIWPLGTTHVTTGHHGTAILHGTFDAWSHDAVRAAHPGQFVSRDGNAITIWPLGTLEALRPSRNSE